ncbi:hypothetical protein QR680_010439 [Steinernema hermaphroditum]|uniref:Caspase family p20 domain-containing protein n=1 Tax=Steinernema hermaphroditum TaxID=289476 RepID=A0AA39MB83_9BILA|nr:hypothetical protein QR680_010439 [Steinernema hermaphroditum]
MAGTGKLTKAQNDCLMMHLNRMIMKMDVRAVLDYLGNATVVNSYAKQEILEKDHHEQAYELYSLLKRKGELAFKVFYDALRTTGHCEFAAIIDQEAPVSDPEDSYTDWNFPNPISRKSSFRSSSFRSKDKPNVMKRGVTGDEDKEFRMNMSLPSSSSAPSRSSFYTNENINVGARLTREVSCIFPDDAYHMTSSPKGNVLIINNINFNTMPYRDGSYVDEDNLRKLFNNLDYRVHAYKNLKAEEMCTEMRRFAALEDHRYRSSAVVVVLSHGEAGVLYGCDDREVNEHRFISALNAVNAPLLAGKPKLFLMQACRGEGKDRGYAIDEVDGNIPSSAGGDRMMRVQNDGSQMKLPLEADILICRSTPLGYVSWRNSRDGTWFIQALCEVFKECARTDEIMTLLTKVNNRVSSKFESSKERCKQIGEISSRLRKKLFFFPQEEHSTPNTTLV